jgi:hypothetical protein
MDATLDGLQGSLMLPPSWPLDRPVKPGDDKGASLADAMGKSGR